MSTIEDKERDKEYKKVKNSINDIGRNIGKKLAGKFAMAIPIIIKIISSLLLAILFTGIVYEIMQWLNEVIQGENTANTVYEALEVENLSELVEIKGDETSGYYLGFSSDIDEKLDKVIEKLDKDANSKKIADKELLKKMMKAELVSQFPNLGAGIGNVSVGVDTIIQKAQEVADYVYNDGGYKYGDASVNPAMDKTEKVVSCDRFVGWVLYECGYVNQPTVSGLALGRLQDFLDENGWVKITNPTEYRAGDIMFTDSHQNGTVGHTFICAGQGSSANTYLRYDMGSDERIQSKQPFDEPITNFMYLYRMPEIISTENDDDEEKDDKFQGTINVRRVTPNKSIGEVRNTGTDAAIVASAPVNSDGLGTKQDIPDDVKSKMAGRSMPLGATVTYDQLSYLTIPYYDFNGDVQQGNMIVNKELADEVLLIFQELYNIKYPIYKMQLIDNYEGEGDNLDFNSIEDNNTSCFCYRNGIASTSLSNHALGQAIDINPLINPYLPTASSFSSHSVTDRCNYMFKDLSKWKDEAPNWKLSKAKEANIDKGTEIYKIFKKYGWDWGGEWSSPVDYQHFEKTDLSSVATIKNTNSTDNNANNSNSTGNVAGDGKNYIVAIDAGHGDPAGAKGNYQTGTSDTSGLNTGMTEWESTRKVADAVADMLSIYDNIQVVRIGNSDQNPIVNNEDRVNLAKEANADLYVTIHYNSVASPNASGTEAYYKPGDNVSKQLAEIMARNVSTSLGIGLHDGGVHEDNYSGKSLIIIKNSNDVGFPCVVVEGGYMSSPVDMEKMKGDTGIRKLCKRSGSWNIRILWIRK